MGSGIRREDNKQKSALPFDSAAFV